MVKYFAAAVALKVFSANSATRTVYRRLGNVLGQKKRKQQNIDEYVSRGDLLVDILRKYGLLDQDLAVLEIGTGWIHWFGLYVALHTNRQLEIELYDVWDNRQLDALKSSFRELQSRWEVDRNISADQCRRLSSMLGVESFDELYEQFNARYLIDSNGSLASYPNDKFDAVFSFHVLEHIHRDTIEESIKHMYRMLKPGGYCIHQIGIDDHLAHYDRSESKKSYLKYSLAVRKRIFQNVVQYHNALQGKDYLNCFERQNFEVIDIAREKINLNGLQVQADWKSYSKEDLETVLFTVVLRKLP